jgi:formylglycine-generating enzyme
MFYEEETKSFQSFYLQTTEVSNLEYQTFLNDLVIQGRKEEYEVAKVDSAKWVELYGEDFKEIKNMNFHHPVYKNFPVSNISRSGDELYCKWLTEEFDKFNKRLKFYHTSPRYTYVRLPCRSEW